MKDINGRTTIEEYLKTVYKKQEPLLIQPEQHNGEDPLEEILIYKNEEKQPHWHYITLGLTELYEKESSHEEVSGFGFELSLRLLRKPDEKQPPTWAYSFLQNIARYVFESGEGFEEYQYMSAGGPICQDEPTELSALTFVTDPQLSPLATPNGNMLFLQVVALTEKEMQQMAGEKYLDFIRQRRKNNPWLITDLSHR